MYEKFEHKKVKVVFLDDKTYKGVSGTLKEFDQNFLMLDDGAKQWIIAIKYVVSIKTEDTNNRSEQHD